MEDTLPSMEITLRSMEINKIIKIWELGLGHGWGQ